MSELDEFYVHRVTVEMKQGSTGMGEPITVHSEPIPCFIRNATRLIRDQNGQHLIGSTEITCDNSYASRFVQDSDVYQLDGDDNRTRLGAVQLVDIAESGDMQLPDHTTITII